MNKIRQISANCYKEQSVCKQKDKIPKKSNKSNLSTRALCKWRTWRSGWKDRIIMFMTIPISYLVIWKQKKIVYNQRNKLRQIAENIQGMKLNPQQHMIQIVISSQKINFLQMDMIILWLKLN